MAVLRAYFGYKRPYLIWISVCVDGIFIVCCCWAIDRKYTTTTIFCSLRVVADGRWRYVPIRERVAPLCDDPYECRGHRFIRSEKTMYHRSVYHRSAESTMIGSRPYRSVHVPQLTARLFLS